ncbi:hypothetical protein [Streptomyces sp. NPDC059649]|uniref:hypothetical protein n=1 Tax=Streptomyces sp. NPDC059649 TaxID=3346895 RepID=UPI0036876E63
MNVTPTGGVFGRLDNEWPVLCADHEGRGVLLHEWLMADCLAAEVAAVTDSRARAWGQAVARHAAAGRIGPTRWPVWCWGALLKRAAGHDRSATSAARIVVQAMIPALGLIARGQVRPFDGDSLEDIGHVVIAVV